MSDYLTEEEQVEALKKWWRENGKAIVGGAVLGLALVGGWQAWQSYQKGEAELASAYYEEFMLAAKAGATYISPFVGRLEQASGLVDAAAADSYAGEFAVLRGDLAMQQGDKARARAAYQEALLKGAGNAELVRMKLVELKDADAS